MEKKESVYISESVGILCCALCLRGGVTQGKDDRSFIQRSHGLDDIMGEQASSSCHTWVEETEMLAAQCLWSVCRYCSRNNK